MLAHSRLGKEGGSSNAVVVAITAREAYQVAISPAALARKSSLEAATTALHIALESATTDNGKVTADDAFKTAVRAANEGL